MTTTTMAHGQLPPSARKHIRQEKGRIRREFLDKEKRKEEIKKLYEHFSYYLEPEKKKNTKNKKSVKK